MEFKKIQEKIVSLQQHVSPKFHLYSLEEKAILTKTVKLNEEVGELCNDILSILQLQRKSKLDKFEKKNIYQEFADVIIVTMQLAAVCGVDVERAILDKLNKIEHKYLKDHKK